MTDGAPGSAASWQLSDALARLGAALPRALVGGPALARLAALAQCPAPWPRVTYALEARLAAGAAQVDLAFRLADVGPLAPFARAAADGSAIWTALARLAERLGEPATRALIADLWLEFDLDHEPTRIPKPALFLGARRLRRRRDEREADFRQCLTAIVELVQSLAGDAGTDIDVAALCRGAEALPDGGRLFQIGLMLSRPSTPLRLVVQRIAAEQIYDYLAQLGREGHADVVRELLDGLDAAALNTDLQLDVGDPAAPVAIEVSPRLAGVTGVEHWHALGERLVALGMCSAEKAAALREWPSTDSPASRWLSHLKVICDTNGLREAKAYLFFSAVREPAPTSAVRRPFERIEAGERFYDYCHFRYKPLKRPEGKLRAVEVLYRSFELAGAPPAFWEFVDAIRREIGANQTVFGVKMIDGRWAWEFYFYDYARQERQISVPRFLRLAEPYFTCPLTLDERMPYFMFSVDIREEFFASHQLNGVHLYVNSMCGEHTPTALSYMASPERLVLENHYAFFDATKEMDRIIKKLRCSATADLSDVGLQEVILPELYNCYTICIANKSVCDTIYYSRVRVDQLGDFLARFDYPMALREFVDEHRTELDHLYTCVGFDFAVRDGQLEVLKSGFYGTF